MQRPSIKALDEETRAAVCQVARVLKKAGRRAWIVGGVVRDLALARPAKDVDLATPARPDELEALFEVTHPVGKAFGTVIVVEAGLEMQVTTFRADGAYTDARHPDAVVFGDDLESDARRRDFTCNAMYLDPLTDELADPERGLEDLERGRLRCVGDAAQRFREDGLRLLRMGRFAAVYGLAIDPVTMDAARGALDALAGVSAERIYGELANVAAKGAAPGALRILADAGILARALPGLGDQGALERRLEALARFGNRPDVVGVLALLFDPLDPAGEKQALGYLQELRPPRAVVEGVRKLWRMARDARRPEAGAEEWERRAARIRLVREPEWEAFVALSRAWGEGKGEAEPVAGLAAFAAGLAADDIAPTPFLTSADLAAAGIPPGPRWGELLRQAEDLQLGGAHGTREDALAWLGERADSPP